jgi:hypothetical protein
MKVFVTKYVLYAQTQGILECEAEEDNDIVRVHRGTRRESFVGEGTEWHRTRAAAVARAKEMRKAKIASLKKQIARLEALKWEVE